MDAAAGLILAAAAAFALLWLIPANVEPAGGEFDVSPRFVPGLAAWAVLGLSLLLVARRPRRRAPQAPAAPEPPEEVPLSPAPLSGAATLAETAAWAAVATLTVLGLSSLGFLVVAPLLLLAGMLVAGARRWLLIGPIAVLFPLLVDRAAWLVFTVDLP